MQYVYLDNASTTKPFQQVIDVMALYMTQEFGNPSSLHYFGRQAKNAIEDARSHIARLLDVDSTEIIFTSGGTEANNHALIGAAMALNNKGNHIITSVIEHHSVLETCSFLETLGFHVTPLPVDSTGLVDPGDFKKAITDKTIIASVMHGNNETGTIEPLEKLTEIAQQNSIVFHSDAVQTIGHLDFSIKNLKLDLLSASAHKFNGPKGIGFLYVKRGTPLQSLLHGGSQELRMRAGTQNVAAIVGMAKALELSLENLEECSNRINNIKKYFIAELQQHIKGMLLNGKSDKSLPGIVNVTIPGTDADILTIALDRKGIACSSGSACTSAHFEPSHVITALGRSKKEAASTLRFSFGYDTTIEDAKKAIAEIAMILNS